MEFKKYSAVLCALLMFGAGSLVAMQQGPWYPAGNPYIAEHLTAEQGQEPSKKGYVVTTAAAIDEVEAANEQDGAKTQVPTSLPAFLPKSPASDPQASNSTVYTLSPLNDAGGSSSATVDPASVPLPGADIPLLDASDNADSLVAPVASSSSPLASSPSLVAALPKSLVTGKIMSLSKPSGRRCTISYIDENGSPQTIFADDIDNHGVSFVEGTEVTFEIKTPGGKYVPDYAVNMAPVNNVTSSTAANILQLPPLPPGAAGSQASSSSASSSSGAVPALQVGSPSHAQFAKEMLKAEANELARDNRSAQKIHGLLKMRQARDELKKLKTEKAATKIQQAWLKNHPRKSASNEPTPAPKSFWEKYKYPMCGVGLGVVAVTTATLIYKHFFSQAAKIKRGLMALEKVQAYVRDAHKAACAGDAERADAIAKCIPSEWKKMMSCAKDAKIATQKDEQLFAQRYERFADEPADKKWMSDLCEKIADMSQLFEVTQNSMQPTDKNPGLWTRAKRWLGMSAA